MGVYLSEPITQKTMYEGAFNSTFYCVAEMQGWRKKMEDAALTEDLGDYNSLFAVFDGHGGAQVSKFVAKQFRSIFTSLPQYHHKDYKGAMREAFRLTDLWLLTPQTEKLMQKERMPTEQTENVGLHTGCTANVVLITPSHIIVANAGDSRSVICKGNFSKDLSVDHKPQLPEQFQRITRAGGIVQGGRVNGGLNLSRSFGDFSYKQNGSLPYNEQMITCAPCVEVYSREDADEFVLIGCDGIWERYVENSADLIQLLKNRLRQQEPKAVLAVMLDQLLAKDTSDGFGCDNMTAILVRFANQV